MSVDGLKIPHIFANLVGITPSLLKNNNQKRQFSDTIRGILFIAIFVSANTYLIYGKIVDYGKKIHITVLYTYSLMELIVTGINISSIYMLNLRHGHRWRKFLKELQALEMFTIDKTNIPKANIRFLLEFYTCTILAALFGCYSGYVHSTALGWNVYKYFLAREFQNSHIGILLTIVTQYPKLIAMRMTELNEHLQLYAAKGPSNYIFTESAKSRGQIITLTIISEAYTSIAWLIMEYNELIGPICLLYCGNMILNIMVPINMALLLMKGIPVNSDASWGIVYIVFCIIWIGFPCVIGMKLFYVCDSAEKEAGKVPELCYFFIKTFGNNKIDLQPELTAYATQASQIKPKFSAAGYFDVNLGLTMPIFGSIFTYIIVLMQFHNL